jgi:homoaconitase/3-isopropylmalate dehydratase large subunit
MIDVLQPMNMAEKILARASGRDFVRPGDVIFPHPELVIVHDGFIETAHRELSGLGYRRITNPQNVVFVTDHEVIYTSPAAVARGRNNRRIAGEWQVGTCFRWKPASSGMGCSCSPMTCIAPISVQSARYAGAQGQR